jgi:hypothetical protein
VTRQTLIEKPINAVFHCETAIRQLVLRVQAFKPLGSTPWIMGKVQLPFYKEFCLLETIEFLVTSREPLERKLLRSRTTLFASFS